MFHSRSGSRLLWMRPVCVILLAREPHMSFAQQASPWLSTVATVSEAKPAPKDATALDGLLKHDGFMAVKLKQANLDKDPKRLVVDIEINRVSALFQVDTGAGGTFFEDFAPQSPEYLAGAIIVVL